MLSNVGSQTFATRTSIYHSVEQKQFMIGRGHYFGGGGSNQTKKTQNCQDLDIPLIYVYINMFIHT